MARSTSASTPSLESIEGFHVLEEADGVTITSNNAMSDIRMTSLRTMTSGLTVTENDSLELIDFPALEAGSYFLHFFNNAALPECAVDELALELESRGYDREVRNLGNDLDGVCR